MPRHHVSMTFDLVTDRAGSVENAARQAFQGTADLAQTLGGGAEGIEGSAVSLGLCMLLGEALTVGLKRVLPEQPQVQGLDVSATEVDERIAALEDVD